MSNNRKFKPIWQPYIANSGYIYPKTLIIIKGSSVGKTTFIPRTKLKNSIGTTVIKGLYDGTKSR